MLQFTISIHDILLSLLGIVTLWLVFDRFAIKRKLRQLEDALTRNERDISAMCAAAVSVDSRILQNSQQVQELLQRLDELKREDIAPQSYTTIIQKVKEGATVNELMQNCGLSRDEAALLIRLHGQAKSLYP